MPPAPSRNLLATWSRELATLHYQHQASRPQNGPRPRLARPRMTSPRRAKAAESGSCAPRYDWVIPINLAPFSGLPKFLHKQDSHGSA